MKRVLILTLLLAASFAHTQDIAGDWQGTLSAGGTELRLVLHITKSSDGSLKATLDSIDQPGANGIPVFDHAQGFQTRPRRGCGPRHVRRQGRRRCQDHHWNMVARGCSTAGI